ncbi:MAG: hypothetical protein IT179_07915 [Acidobacteria bacterium]|nr:hypothetical protein [Acidobacteriota bacterium]
MAKKRTQRRWVKGSQYRVIGRSGKERSLKLVGRIRMGRKELLVFQPLRKASKFRHKTKKTKRTLKRAA